MKTFAAVALALASVAYAQLDAIPSCALTCMTTVIASDGCDGITDFACHCKQTGLVTEVQPCIKKSCTAAEEEATIAAVEQICADAGVPITISSGASTTSAAASSTSSVASSTTTEESSSSSSAAATTAAETSTSAAATTVVTSASAGTVTPSAGSNSTVTTASTPASYTGGAAIASAGSFAGFALAVAAMAGL